MQDNMCSCLVAWPATPHFSLFHQPATKVPICFWMSSEWTKLAMLAVCSTHTVVYCTIHGLPSALLLHLLQFWFPWYLWPRTARRYPKCTGSTWHLQAVQPWSLSVASEKSSTAGYVCADAIAPWGNSNFWTLSFHPCKKDEDFLLWTLDPFHAKEMKIFFYELLDPFQAKEMEISWSTYELLDPFRQKDMKFAPWDSWIFWMFLLIFFKMENMVDFCLCWKKYLCGGNGILWCDYGAPEPKPSQ